MNSFGRKFRVSLFGESHGEMLGVTLDGVPSGLPLSPADLTEDLLRRKSGAMGTTARLEADEPQLVSGTFQGHTTGSPLTILFTNRNVKSQDYDLFTAVPRPGHADFTAHIKWAGFNDPRGGGHFSGRLTLPIVAAGVVAKKMIPDLCIHAEISELGGIPRPKGQDDGRPPECWKKKLEEALREQDSLGAVVSCKVTGLQAGLGEPFFDSMESLISHAIFSIPGVRGIEFGDGFAAARMKGSEHNDPWSTDAETGQPVPMKNGAGGINGGLSNGNPLVFRVAFKPTSSIGQAQQTLNLETGRQQELKIKGRHDACFALRTPVIVEAMAAIVLADFMSLK